MTVVDDLRRIRESAGLSHRAVSERMGLPNHGSQVCEWEQGRKSPRLSSFTSWAAALGQEVRLAATDAAPSVRLCPECGQPIGPPIRRRYCTKDCYRTAAKRRRRETREAANLDPLVVAHIHAVRDLYRLGADEVVHALGLTTPAAIAYARQVCEEVSRGLRPPRAHLCLRSPPRRVPRARPRADAMAHEQRA